MAQSDFLKSERVAWSLLVSICGGAVLWAAWVSTSLAERPDRGEVLEMVQTHAPYNQDRKALWSEVHRAARTNEDLKRVVEDLTKTVQLLEKTVVRLDEKLGQ